MGRAGPRSWVLLLAGLAVAPLIATATEPGPRYWFLDRLGAADLVPADWQLLRQNIQLALYELGDGQSVGWTEPGSEHSGSVRVLRTTQTGPTTCRRLRVSVDVGVGSDDGVFDLCRTGPEGFWRLTTSSRELQYEK